MMKQFKHYFNAFLAAVVLLAGLPGTFTRISAADTRIWGIDAAEIVKKAGTSGHAALAKQYGIESQNPYCFDDNSLLVKDANSTLGKEAVTFNARRGVSLGTAGTFQFTKADKPDGTAPEAMQSGVYIVEVDFANKVLNAANQVQYVLRGTDNAALATVALDNTAKQLSLQSAADGTPLSIDATGSTAAPGYLRLEADLTKHTVKAYAYAYANSTAIGTKPSLEDCTLLGEVSFDAGVSQLTAMDVLVSNAENSSSGKWNANIASIYSVTVTEQEQQSGGEVTEVLPEELAAHVELQLDFEDNTTATKGQIVSADDGFTYAEGIHGKALILKTEATPRRISLGQYDFADKTLTLSMRSEAFGKAGYPVILGNNDSYTLPYSGFDLSYWGSNTDRFEMQCGDTAAGSKIKKNIQFKHSTEGPGDWMNIAVAFDNTGKKATGYLNGEKCAEINTSDLADRWMNGTGLNFHIGNDGTAAGCPDNARNSFELWMDNFRIFDKVLTADEVKTINTADQKAKESHTVTVQSADETKGTAAVVTEGTAFEEGSSVTVRATAKAGFSFSGWTAEGITLNSVQQGSNPLTFTMPKADVALTANFTEEAPADGNIKIGVLSDTQLTAQYSEYRYTKMESMLQQFKNANVDVIMMPGDITDKAEAGAYDKFWASYRKVYPVGEPGPVFLPIMGNHDFWNGHFENKPNDLPAALALYKEKMGLESENIAQKVKGYHFIGVSTDTDYDYDQETIDWLAAQLAAAAADTPDKPIFVMQHANVKGTVVTSDEWGNDQLTEVLNRYPQIVHFSGHAHFPLQDERSIYQENFTAIATAAIAYLELESGKEGGTKPAGYNDVGQGIIADVTTDKITIARLDAATGKKVAADWEIPVPIRKENFTYTKDRAAARTAPAFAQDAAPEASAITDKTARITAPAATHDNFVYSYRMEVVNTDLNATVSNKLYFSDWWKDIENMAKTVTFDIDGLKAETNYKVNLYAQESFGKEGAPISVTFVTEAKPQNAEMITFDLDEIYNAYKEVDPTIKADGTGANKDIQSGWMKTGAGITVSTSLSYCYDNNFMKSASWTLGKMALISNSRAGKGYCNPTKYDFTASTTINPNPTELSEGMFRLEMDLNNYMEAADVYLDYVIVGNGGDILKLRADRNSKTVSLRDADGNLIGTAHTLASEKAAPIYVRLDIDMVSKKINAWVGNYANVNEVGTAPALENCTQLVESGSFLNDSALITGMDIWAQTAASGSLVSAIYGLKVSEVQVERPTYTLTAQSADAAMGTVSTQPEEEAFLEGTNVTITATPAEDHLFTGWNAQGMTLTEEQKMQNPLTFAMPSANVTLTASFAFDTEISITPETATYDKYAQSDAHQNLVFALKTGGKEVTAVKLGDTILAETTDYTLSGKTLTVLTGALDAQSGNVPLAVTLGEDTEVTAAVTIVDTTPILLPHTVTVIPGTGGSARVSGDRTAFKAGEEVTLTASANSGYAFSQWTSTDVTLTANGATATFIMPDKEVTVRAYFTKNQPSGGNTGGSSSGGGRGTGSGSSSAVVLPGSTNNNNNNNNQPPETDHLTSNHFNDITSQNTWAYGYIEHLAAAGIVSGDQNRNFNPKNNITREEFLKMLLGALDIDVTAGNGSDFTDVGNGDWFAPYVGKACELGIVNGMGDGSFGIGQNITREDMAVMASRALAAANKTLPPTQQTALIDMAQVSGYAQSSVQQLTAAGVISGDENAAFRPLNNALREEAAKIVYLILAA